MNTNTLGPHYRQLYESELLRTQIALRLADRVSSDGSIQDRCQSRIAESALLWRLLRNIGCLPEIQSRLVRYIERTEPASTVERIIHRAVLTGESQHAEAEAFLGSFKHLTGERKKILLSTLLALTGAASNEPIAAGRKIEYRGHAVWTELVMCAIKIIRDEADGGSIPDDRQFLMKLLCDYPPSRVWQGNALAHLLGLHGLFAFAPHDPQLRAGVTALASQLNSDGGVPFIVGQDIWVSALAGLALAESGIVPEAASWLGEFIAARQLSDGGWGYDRNTTQSDVDDTSRCVVFLHALDSSKYAGVLHSGLEYLNGMAGEDGGFPTYLRGDPSEPDLTAGAALALATGAPPPADTLRRAGLFLLSAQSADGSFDPSWTRSHSSVVAHVVRALRELCQADAIPATHTEQAISRSVKFLVQRQNLDGGWGHRKGQVSDAISTSHAIDAISGHADPRVVSRAVSNLLLQRDLDGFAAPPDQVGPRPIPYDFPVLADIHVLSSLNRLHALARGRDAVSRRIDVRPNSAGGAVLGH